MKETELAKVFGALPIRGPVAFSNRAGKFKERLRRQQLTILSPIVDELRYQLDHDEEILFAARAISPFTLVEQLVTGWSIYYMKRCILVLTNKRILHFPTTYRYKGKSSISMVRFPDIAKYKAGRKTVLTYKNGVKETFYGVLKGRKFRAVMDSLKIASSASSSRGGRHHLCPKCTASLVPERYACPRCRLEFKAMGKARLLSIFLPGGGYFYTRHPILGFLDGIVEIWLMAAVILFAFGPQLHMQDFVAPDLSWAAIFLAAIVYEKFVTVYHADHFVKEYIPVEKEFSRLPKPAPPAKIRIDLPQKDLEDERVTFK